MRSVNHVASKARRKKMIKHAKGYFGRRKNVWTVAKNAIEKGWQYAYRDRKVKKREFRALWIQRINAACRQYGVNYSQMISGLKQLNIELDRKQLSFLATESVDDFKTLVHQVKAVIAEPSAKKVV